MAKHPKRRSGKGKVKRAVRTGKSRPRVVKNPSTVASRIGSAVATGARTLISCVPGSSFILPAVDFVFKELGLTTAALTNQQLVKAETHVVGLQAWISLPVASLMTNSTSVIMLEGFKNHTQSFSKAIMCKYTAVMVKRLVIVVAPNGETSNRAGTLHVGFSPYLEARINHNPNALPDIETVRACRVSTSGPATRAVELVYNSNIMDSTLEMKSPSDQFGEVIIYYDHMNRDNYSSFKPSEFSCQIELRASITETQALGDLVVNYNDSTKDTTSSFVHSAVIKDKLSSVGMSIKSPDSKSVFLLSKQGFTCKPSADLTKCIVTGAVLPARALESLELMELE